MRLGLLADIHESVELLAAAVQELNARRVDAFVMLGDVLETGERADETVAILAALPGVGVWGNHDLGLCGEVHPSVGARFATTTLDYFASLRARVDVAGNRFQHIDPHLDAERFEHLWQFATSEERIAGFRRCPESRVFMGHLHRWGVFTPESETSWNGAASFQYQRGARYLTVVNAVCRGWCAILDTERDEIEPIPVA